VTLRHDVIVVGALPGRADGEWLARRGLRVLMIERARFPSDTLSGHMITLRWHRRPRGTHAGRSACWPARPPLDRTPGRLCRRVLCRGYVALGERPGGIGDSA
jgi:hypothetical protein